MTEPIKQPEPLRLADALSGVLYSADDVVKAAAELRRLHGEVERLQADHAEDQSVIAVWRGRTQRAETMHADEQKRKQEPSAWIIDGDLESLMAEGRRAVLTERDELRAEVERLRDELARLTRPNLFWVSGGEDAACEELGEMAERIAEDFYGDARECTETIDCARTLPSVQMRVWIDDAGGWGFECPILDVKVPK
jgi:hypothetical protein